MIPQTVLAQQQARRLAKSRRKPPRQTLPLQTERLYLGALRRYWGRFESLVREVLAPELGTRTDFDPDQPRDEGGRWTSGAGSQSEHSERVKTRIAQVRAERGRQLRNKSESARAIHAKVYDVAERIRGVLDRFSAGQNWDPDSESRVLAKAIGSSRDLPASEHFAALHVTEILKQAETDIGKKVWKARDLQSKIVNDIVPGRIRTKEELRTGFREWQQTLRGRSARTDARRPPGPIGFVTRHTRTLDTIRPTLRKEIDSLPYDEVSLAVATHVGRQMVKVLGVRASSITSSGNLRAFRQRNVDLITGLTEESLTRIAGILDKLDTVGPLEIAGELDSEFGFGRARAELIARDQVLKYNGEITHEAHRQAGINEYIWSTSQDESVRSNHADLEGTRHSWDDPPVVADDGRTAHPGEDFQCRCVPIPILPELEESP